MLGNLTHRYLARQFARPRGLAGRWIFGIWLNRVNQGMNALALKMLGVRQGDRVLEVGFGGGKLLESLSAAGAAETVGVELSEAMVARARRRFRRQVAGGRISLLTGSVEALPLKDRSVDKACSLNTIYFWNDAEQAMRELARVLRPGGILILGFEAPETLRAWPGHRFGFVVWEPEEVVRLAERAGFGNATVHDGLEPKFGKIHLVMLEGL